MKLIEEKSLVIAQLISLAFIGLLSIGIQMCSSKIDAYDVSIIFESIHSNRKEGERINQQVKSMKYLFSAYVNAKVTTALVSENNKSKYPEAVEIIEKFNNGELNDREYFNKMSSFFNKSEGIIAEEYESILNNIEKKLKIKPIWYMIRKWLIILQIFGILVSIYLHTKIIKSINSRIN